MIDHHIHACSDHNPIERIIEELSELSIHEAILLPWVRKDELTKDFDAANQYVLMCARDTSFKFHPYCSISMDLRFPKDIKRYEGIKWHCLHDPKWFYSGWKDDDLDDLIKQIKDTGLPVLIEDELPFINEFTERCGPEMKIIVPHMGIYPHADFMHQDIRLFWEQMKNKKNVIFDSALAGPLIKKGIDFFGRDRVRYGSDSPFGNMENELKQWKDAAYDRA